ncbi:MAG: transglutaminase [Bacteroidetes bacterium]|nr:MAG: transglutaminase [Bacteroidota bacterium]
MQQYLKETPLLDYSAPSITTLIEGRRWRALDTAERVKAAYGFVRDEILFGYNAKDEFTASEVLADGYGQCNTKATLLIALLRALGVPCRLHGSTIDKALQKGAVTGIWYRLSPQRILHSWAEVQVDGEWYSLEGVILDRAYLEQLQARFKGLRTSFCGYGVHTDCLANPPIDWEHSHTYIQRKGMKEDFGIFGSPDDFYREHQQQMRPLKRFIYQHLVRHLMNANVHRIRRGEGR